MLTRNELKAFLDEKYDLYNRPSFIESDPIQIPHTYTRKEDIEIMAFLTSQIAWGNRKMIIRNAQRLAGIMEQNPHDFILHASEHEFETVSNFTHRTFNRMDLIFFLQSLQNIYRNHKGLETVFTKGFRIDDTIFSSINYFRNTFFELQHEQRTEKHIANVHKKSAAKRINLFLMWMIRKDNRGVHFGLWDKIPSHALKLPLDVHSGNTARALGLLIRKQNDWQATEELTDKLKEFDSNDPVKYDFALFGLGVFEKFGKL